MKKSLTTVSDIIAELGGPTAVAGIAALDATPSAVWNWADRQRFPAKKYLVISSELRQRGINAPASLFGIQE